MADLHLFIPNQQPAVCRADKSDGTVVGRDPACDIVIADPRVSARHLAVFPSNPQGSRWFVTDLNSRHGVTINNSKIPPAVPTPIMEGDWIGAGPVMMRVGGRQTATSISHATLIDGPPSRAAAPASVMLGMAELQHISRISAASGREELFTLLLDCVLSITKYARAVIAEVPSPSVAMADIIASKDNSQRQPSVETLSRSLLRSALQSGSGVFDGAMGAGGHSIQQSLISAACCIRLSDDAASLGPTLVLYLDSRGEESLPRAGSVDIAIALAKVATACLGRLAAMELEKRHAELREELKSARGIQEQLMPPASGTILGGVSSFELLCIPGRVVAGDIADVIDLGPDNDGSSRAALIIGDVMGKGAAAGMLMASIQARVSQGLADGVALDRLVAELNRDVSRRCPGMMASLWIGVVTMRADRTAALVYVDAGHGLCLLRRVDGSSVPLTNGGGPVLGVGEGIAYQAAHEVLESGTQLVLVTDGLPEQPDPQGQQLGMTAVAQRVSSNAAAPDAAPSDAASLVKSIADLLRAHSKGAAQRDDVTVLVASL